MASNAFDTMNESAGDDMYITGGSIIISDYEHNMTPGDQKKFEALVMEEFMANYGSDPHKGNLDFNHWLKSLNFNLLRERALKFDDIKAKNNGTQRLMRRPDGRELEDAGMLQRLAHLHTGRIEDLAEIVSTMEPGAAVGAAPPVDTSAQGMFNYKGTNKELSKELGLDPESIPRNPRRGG